MTDQNKPSPYLPDDTDTLKARILELEQQVSDSESVRESLIISEARYKTIIDNLKDVIFTIDVQGIVTYVTTSVGQYGYHPQDILGHNMLEFVHPDDWQMSVDVHNKLIGETGEMSFVIRMLTRDGQLRFLEDCAKAVVNKEGKVISTVGVLRDITEKKAAEDALEKMNSELEKYVWQRTVELCKAQDMLQKEGQQRMKAEVAKDQSDQLLAGMINFLPDPTFMIDRDSRVMIWNQAMEKLTGVPAEDILQKGDYEYALPFYGRRRPILIDFALNPDEHMDKDYPDIRHQGDSFIAEAYVPLLKEGQPMYLWGIAKPYYDARGRILGAIESIRDVTAIHNIAQKLSKEVDKFRALYDLALNMSAEKSLDDNLKFIVEKSRALMATDAAYIALIDDKRQRLFMHTQSGIRTAAFQTLHIPLDRGTADVILKNREGRIIDDYLENGEITPDEKKAIHEEGLASTLAVPICAAEKNLGVLYVSNRKKTVFSKDDLDTLLLFGNLAAVEIERKRAEETTRQNADRIQRHNAAIMKLATDETMASGDIHEIFGILTETASEAIGIDRVSVWLLSKDAEELCLADLFEAGIKKHSRGMILKRSDYPHYFDAIHTKRKIIAGDARDNPDTREFTDGYLVPLGITSMLDTGIHLAGRLTGVVCLEHTGIKRDWQPDEEVFANTVATLAAQTLVSMERHKAENDLRESERKHRIITEKMIDIVWIADMNLQTSYITPSVKAVLGFSQEDIPRTADKQMTPASLAVAFETLARELALEGQGQTDPDRNVALELEYYHKDGSTRWLEALISGLRDDQGVLTGLHGVSRDITKRKLMEQELQESAAKYRTVFETTGSAMVIIEANGLISLVNEEFAKMTGYPKDEIEGKKTWREFIIREDIPRMEAAARKQIFARVKSRTQAEYRFQDREGRQRDILLTANLIPGTRKGVASLVDITNRKKAEADLKKAHDELESRVAQRTQQLTTANEGLKELLQKQDVNIDLAKNILALINPRPQRHMFIGESTDLFFTAFYLPCYAEGGDHFFIKNFPDRYPGIHKTALSLKDQSGHEVSCILRSIVTDLIHNALLVNTPDFTLEERITQLNKTICGLTFFGGHNFFTAVNAEFDHTNLKMRYVSAGHPPFLLIRGQDVACLPGLDEAGRNIPVGILGTIDFKAGEIQLQKGDKLIFYTDGFTDIPRRLGEPVFNADDLKDMTSSIIKQYPDLPVSLLISRLFNRINGLEKNDKIINFQGFDDDITLLGLELEDPLHEFEDIIQPLNIDDFSSCAAQLYRKIKDEWQEKGFPSPNTRLQMVLEEALTNAWKHGNQSSPAKRITVRRRYANDAVLEIIDEGDGFDIETFYDPTSPEHILQEHGRGNFIMRMMTDEILWREGGRHLVAFFSRQGADIRQRTDVTRFHLWKRLKKR